MANPSYFPADQLVLGATGYDSSLPTGSMVTPGATSSDSFRQEKILATVGGVPGSGYVRTAYLAGGEKRTLLSTGLELCENVQIRPSDFISRNEFAHLTSTTTLATGTYGNQAGGISSGTAVGISSPNSYGVLGIKSSTSANSGYYHNGDFSLGNTISANWFIRCRFLLNITTINANFGHIADWSVASDQLGMAVKIRSGLPYGYANDNTTSVSTPAGAALLASTWYTSVCIKNGTNYQFALVDDANIVQWYGSLANGPSTLSSCSPGLNAWYDGTPSVLTQMAYIDWIEVGTLAALRKQSGIAALPYLATSLKFY